jgi:hypothetical protein
MNQGLPPETESWEHNLQQFGGSLLQSWAWAAFQQALGREPVWSRGKGWQWLAAVRHSRGLHYLMCGYGPTATGAQAMEEALTSLVTAGRELSMDFVRIEPQRHATPAVLDTFGAQRIGEADPEHTRVIDLQQNEGALRAALASGHRNLINGTERRGITIHHMTNAEGLGLFLAMLKDTARHSGITVYADDYYRTLLDKLLGVQLYVAKADGQPVASAIFYDWQGTRYYAHAGAFQELNRKAKASVSLVWQAILDAKAMKMKHFDLWGTAPIEESEHRLAGITKFKAAFGGESVDYLGTWDIPLKPAKYRAYGVYRRLRGRS